MAITLKSLTAGAPMKPAAPEQINRSVTRFFKSFTSGDVTGNETIQAAGGANTKLVIEQLVVFCCSDITLTINEDTTALISNLPANADAGPRIEIIRKGDTPLVLTTNTALKIDGSGAGTVTGIVEGYITD